VVNLSSYIPTRSEKLVLAKGLSFCHLSLNPDKIDLLADIYQFERKVKLKHHFRNADNVPFQGGNIDTMYKQSKGWTPPSGTNTHLDRFLNCVTMEATDYVHPGNRSSFTPQESKALKDLRANPNIVIKPADKGGAVVIWGTKEYRDEANKQLSDRNFYRKVGRDNTESITKAINAELKTACKNGKINIDQRNYLTVTEPRTPCFYMLPKIHKQGNPGRPIVSACGGPTSKLSGFIDEHLKKVVTKVPSYLKDTTDFLSKLGGLTLPNDVILATIDVKSLYTNIPVEEGIRAVGHALSTHQFTTPLPQLLKFLQLVLNNNEFEFDGKHYKQVKGCAMGTPCAPNFANLFMSELETKLLRDAPGPVPFIWWRYIDDIFII
jgi:hypothetical protein